MNCPCCGEEMADDDTITRTRTGELTASVYRCYPCEERETPEPCGCEDHGYRWTEYHDRPPHDLEQGFDPRGYCS